MRHLLAKYLVLLGGLCAALAYEAGAVTRGLLADPARMMQTAERVDFVGQNAFARVRSPNGAALRSTPQNSASGLYQRVNIRPKSLGPVTWVWRVDKLQKSADMRKLEREDSGATIFFVFGEPSMSNKDVPTLAYTWTSTPVGNGTVLKSLRYNSLRYIQLRGRGDVGAWREERRDVARDYRSIFGAEPPALIYVAVFNDNDQTGEPVSALFGPIAWGE
jgi:hypothetical protein